MLTRKKISEILENWELQKEEVKDIYYEETGNYSENAFCVGENYVLKYSANLGNVTKHIELTKALQEEGFWAAGIVKTADGREVVEDNGIYCYVTTRLQGVPLKASDMLSADHTVQAQFLGEILGQLHQALLKLDIVSDETNAFLNVKNWALQRTKEILYVPESICKEYLAILEENYDKLPRQIIHRDPNPSNVIRNTAKDNNEWGFIDFELSEKNVRIYDPCYAATAILSEWFMAGMAKEVEKWPEVYKNIFDGYDRVAKLSKEERIAVPYIILTNQFICVAWFADQGKYEDMLKANIRMTEWILEHFEKLKL